MATRNTHVYLINKLPNHKFKAPPLEKQTIATAIIVVPIDIMEAHTSWPWTSKCLPLLTHRTRFKRVSQLC